MAGHITKRKRGDQTKWRARYPDPTRGGTAQIERTFDRRKEAERWLRAQQVSVDRGSHIDPKDTERRFSHIVDAWRATWLELEPKTKAGYESILNKHVLPRWRDAQIGAVGADAIQKWINEIAAKRSPKTVRNIYGVLRSVLNVAVEHRYIIVNPCEAVRLPKDSSDAEEMLFLTPQEVADLAEASPDHFRVLVYTAAYSGLRAGELGALRRRDVDLLHARLHVRRALKDVNTSSENIADEDKGLIFGPTKTGKSRRVGLPKFLVAMLTEHLATVPADPDALVFTAPEGGPLRHGNFYRRHFKPTVRRRYCAKCQAAVKHDAEACPQPRCQSDDIRYVLPPAKHGLRFHDLRHTCASILIAQNAHPFSIKEHLGHKDIQTTFNRYAHLLPSAEEALAAALDAAYSGSLGEDDDEDIPRIGTQ